MTHAQCNYYKHMTTTKKTSRIRGRRHIYTRPYMHSYLSAGRVISRVVNMLRYLRRGIVCDLGAISFWKSRLVMIAVNGVPKVFGNQLILKRYWIKV